MIISGQYTKSVEAEFYASPITLIEKTIQYIKDQYNISSVDFICKENHCGSGDVPIGNMVMAEEQSGSHSWFKYKDLGTPTAEQLAALEVIDFLKKVV